MAAREVLRLRPPAPAAARSPRPAAARVSAPEPRARRRSFLGLPLDALQLARIEQLERLVGPERYRGWGRVDFRGAFFVDVLDSTGELDRFYGNTLHLALGEAIRAAKGTL